MKVDVNRLSRKAIKVCEKEGWKRDWSMGGCYLHLESSEFIEALRGKGEDSPEDEAADVLFVLFSMLEAHGISVSEVCSRLDNKCEEYLQAPPVEGFLQSIPSSSSSTMTE